MGLKKDCKYVEKCMYNMVIEMLCGIGGRTSHSEFDCDTCNCYMKNEETKNNDVLQEGDLK